MAHTANDSTETRTSQRSALYWSLAALIVIVSLWGNLAWIRQNVLFVGHDSTSYMVAALDYRTFLYPLTPQSIFRALTEPEYRPPAIYLASQPFFALFGWNMDGGQILNIVLHAVVILLTLALARQVTQPWPALFAAALVAFLPMMVAMARLFYTEMLLTAMVALNLLALYRCRNFSNRAWSLVWGLSLGFGLLVKWTMPIYLWLPALAVLWSARRTLGPSSWRPNWRAGALALLPAALFVAIWFLPNRTLAADFPLGDWLALGWFVLAWAFSYALLVRRSPAANLAAAILGALLLASLWYLPHSDIVALLIQTDEERATQAGGLFNLSNWLRYGRFIADHHLGRLALWIVVPATLIPWLWMALGKRRLLNRRATLLLLSLASGVVALMLIAQTSPRNLVPMLPQFAIVAAVAYAWYPRWSGYALGIVTLAVLLAQWATMTVDRLYPFRESTASLWVVPDNAAPPASGPTEPAWWIAPEIVAEVTQGTDERQTLAELVTTGWLHRGQLRYLAQMAGKRLRVIGLTEPGANWEQLIRSSWVLTKSGDPGSVDTPETYELLKRIEGGDALFHALFAPVRKWPLPDGNTVTLWQRAGFLDWDRLETRVEPWQTIAANVRQAWSEQATLLYASPDLGVLVGRYDPAQKPVIVLAAGESDRAPLLDDLRGTVIAVLSPGQEEVARGLGERGYRAVESGAEEGWMAVYGFPEGSLEPIDVEATWNGLRVETLETRTDVAPGEVIPVRVTTIGAAGDDLKWSVRMLDAAGEVIASNDRPLGPADSFGLFVPPSTPPGRYTVAGLAYDPATLTPIANTAGVEMVPLFEVTVTPR